MTDPRSSIRSLLSSQITNGNLLKDDGTTQLTWISVYGPYNIHLTRIFHDKNVDLIFTVEDASRVETKLGVSHLGEYAVTPHAIDKYSGGTKIVTATLVIWQAVKELRRIFKENPWGSLRSLTEDHVEVHDFGGEQVWSKPCRIEYKTYSK